MLYYKLLLSMRKDEISECGMKLADGAKMQDGIVELNAGEDA